MGFWPFQPAPHLSSTETSRRPESPCDLEENESTMKTDEKQAL